LEVEEKEENMDNFLAQRYIDYPKRNSTKKKEKWKIDRM